MVGVVDLFMTDFCPFAQRAWLAFLEKESDPQHPKLFKYREVNYFNPDLPETKEFLAVHNTVPAGIVDGQHLKESMPICYWVDEHYPNNPLQPSDAEGVARMKSLITKFTSGPFDVTGLLYKLTFEQDPSKWDEIRNLIIAAYEELSREIVASGSGPYLMGAQYTIADIALIPFVERTLVLMPHYRGLVIPERESLAPFHAWVKAYSARDSFKISAADRLPRSVATQPFEATKRNEYLIEMYEGYANGVREQVRKQLRHAPPGKKTIDVAAAQQEKAAEEAAKKAQEAKA